MSLKHLVVLIIGVLLITFGLIDNSESSQFNIERRSMGTGHSSVPGFHSSTRLFDTPADEVYFTPQYMPGYPTAATIWPRVIDVKCKRSEIDLMCDGYQWRPEYGRGEYLMFRPVIQKQQPPTKPRIVYVEVPPKKKKQ